jgi:hypothetical protein
MEELKTNVIKLKDHVQDYVQTYVQLAKAKATKGASTAVSGIVIGVTSFFFAFFFLFFAGSDWPGGLGFGGQPDGRVLYGGRLFPFTCRASFCHA